MLAALGIGLLVWAIVGLFPPRELTQPEPAIHSTALAAPWGALVRAEVLALGSFRGRWRDSRRSGPRRPPMAAVERPRLALGMMAIRGLTIVMRPRGFNDAASVVLASCACLVSYRVGGCEEQQQSHAETPDDPCVGTPNERCCD
jgi:hypothetical protein